MDRSFPFIDRNKILLLILCATIFAVITVINKMIMIDGEKLYFISSVFASGLLSVTSVMMISNMELYSKYNSFLIASGTDRTEFINARIIKLTIFNVIAALIFSSADLMINGVNDATVSLMFLNPALALFITTVSMCFLCRKGMTVRTNQDMILLYILALFSFIVPSNIISNMMKDNMLSPTVSAWLLLSAAAVSAIGYIYCRRRIIKIDM